MSEELPVIALTSGDPAGVGPEIVAKALADDAWVGRLRPVAIGDAKVMQDVIAGCGLDLDIRVIDHPQQAESVPGTIDLLDCGAIGDFEHGVVNAACGRAAITYIETACRLAREGAVDGLVTGPINKEAIWAAGSKFPGHTEMLAHLFDVPEEQAVTMFLLGKMRIFFLTRHMSLADAIARLEVGMVERFLRRAHSAIADVGVRNPRLALAALNPHGGENGKMGDEEQTILAPAVEKARAAGVDVVGPVPADAIFHQARQGRYDGVIALFHDQGHIASKTVDFFGTVACELGLPVIRTTVDHGTAFDIAGKWVANASGQSHAMLAAAEFAPGVLRIRRERSAP
jgi:4-phospho-D-threonate 3-dehydrogenase / 4-phospho-D-erythronate 3-dehydrogenase